MEKCVKNLSPRSGRASLGRLFILTFFFLCFSPFLFSWTQTDWSGGDAQLLWPDPSGTSVSKYWWGSEVSGTDTPGSLYLSFSGTTFSDTGILFSSWRDAGEPVIWDKISWLSQDAVLKKENTTLGLWYLDEGGNADTAYDSSGYSNDFRLFGTSWVDGRLGYSGDRALSFGAGNYGEVASPDTRLYTGTLTVECWVYPQAANTAQSIISLGDGMTEGWWLGTNTSNQFQVKIYTASGSFTSTDTDTYTLNTWYHIAFTYDGTNLILYVNGVPKYTNNTSAGDILYSTSPPLRIGYNGSYSWQGRIDMVRIKSQVLSASQILPHAQASYIIFYTRDGDTAATDTDTEENPVSGWSPIYVYGREDYAEIEVSRWRDSFNDATLNTSLWNTWGEDSRIYEDGLLAIRLLSPPPTPDTTGITSRQLTGSQFKIIHYIYPIEGRAVSEISNQDTGYLAEGVAGDTGYRILFENGEIYAQYINDGVMADSQFLGSYTAGEKYQVVWKRWNLGTNKGLLAGVSGVGSFTFNNPTYTPSYLTLYTSQTAYFEDVVVKPIARYLQYRTYLKTLDTTNSPSLEEVKITFEPVTGDVNEPVSYITLPLKDGTDTDLYRIKYIDNQVTYCFGSPHTAPIVIQGTSQDTESGVDYVEISWGKRAQGGSWSTSYNDYTWSPWYIVTNTSTSGDYSTWRYELPINNIEEGGYLVRIRAVDNTGNVESLPTDATKTIEVSETDGGDSSLVNIMKDITPPVLVWETNYKPQVYPSWYAGSITDIDNRDSGWVDIDSGDTWLVSLTPSFRFWVTDRNPVGSVNDCSGLNETALPDSPPAYSYSRDGSTYSAWLTDRITLDTGFEGAVTPSYKKIEITQIPFNQQSKSYNLLRVRVFDRAGNEMSFADTPILVDITPMVTSIYSTTASSTSTSATFYWTSYDPYTQANPSSVDEVSDTYLVRWRLLPNEEAKWDTTPPYGFYSGSLYTSYTYTGLEKGKSYIFQVRYMDKAGNYETQETWGIGGNSYYWTIDRDSPEVTIIQGPAGIITEDKVQFVWRSSGGTPSDHRYTWKLFGPGGNYPDQPLFEGFDENPTVSSSTYAEGETGVLDISLNVAGERGPGRYIFYVEAYPSGDRTKVDTAFRTFIFYKLDKEEAYYPTPPRRFWFWEEGK